MDLSDHPYGLLEDKPTVAEYNSIVNKIHTCLWAAINGKTSAKVVTMGHGGRDSWLALAIVQAIQQDPDLHTKVHLKILSSTWPEDTWPAQRQSYLEKLRDTIAV